MPVDEVATSRERLSFLLARHGQIVNNRLRKALGGESGRTLRHVQVLALLAENGPMGQQALIEALGVDPSVLVTLLNDLERDGLAERHRDTADRRRHIVEMTSRGAQALQAMERTASAIEDDLLAGMSEADRVQLHELLTRLDVVCSAAASREEVVAACTEAASCDEDGD